MSITVRDIQERTFATVIRGYDKDEVDDFLDEVTAAFDALIKENRTLKAGVAIVSESPQTAIVELPKPQPIEQTYDTMELHPDYRAEESAYLKNLETTLRETLLVAQRLADKTVAEAKASSASIIISANSEADGIKSASQQELMGIKSEIGELKASAESYRARFKSLINEQARVLKTDTNLFE